MSALPARYRKFIEEFPDVGQAYQDLGSALKSCGPLDEKTQALIKLGIAVGARLDGGIRSHVRKARQAGASREEIRHAVMLATTTIGFPAMMAGLSAADDTLDAEE